MSNAQGVEGVSNDSPDTQNTQIDYNRSATARIQRCQKNLPKKFGPRRTIGVLDRL